MSSTIERLLVIQDRDRRIAHLTREQEDIPARKKDVESRLTAHRESLKGAQEDLKKNAAGTKQIDVEIEARKQKIARFREQQYQIKSNEEYRALEHEISLVQKEIRDLEDHELELMEQMESLRQLIGGREKDLKQEEGRVVEDQGVLHVRLEKIQAEIHDLQVDRQALAADVDPTWLARYERIFKRTADYAIVRVENGVCGGCHMKLPPQIMHDAKRNLSLTECSFCSRILYWQPS
ncbi:MAG: C4-type zinc ribbon domain-containing protein [Verrucomicrobiota bacterium]